MLLRPPVLPAVFPVRLTRILYGLKAEHYDGFARHQLPHGHEFFAPMDALTAEDSDKNPELQALVAARLAGVEFFAAAVIAHVPSST